MTTEKTRIMQIKKMGYYTTNLSPDRDGRMRLTATVVPRQDAFIISPKEPCNAICKKKLNNSSQMINKKDLSI